MATFDQTIVPATIAALVDKTDAGDAVSDALAVPLPQAKIPCVVVFSPSKSGSRASLGRLPMFLLSYKLQIEAACKGNSDADLIEALAKYEADIMAALCSNVTWLRLFECIEDFQSDRRLDAEAGKRFGVVSIVLTLRTKQIWTPTALSGNAADLTNIVATVTPEPEESTVAVVDTLAETLVESAMATWDKYNASGLPVLAAVDLAIPTGTLIDVVPAESATYDGGLIAKGERAVSASGYFMGVLVGRLPDATGVAVIQTAGVAPLAVVGSGDMEKYIKVDPDNPGVALVVDSVDASLRVAIPLATGLVMVKAKNSILFQ